MRNALIIISLLATTFWTACNNNPVFPLTPEIEFVSISPDKVVQDSIDGMVITLNFKDGDGDLGSLGDGDNMPNLFVVDKRPPVVDSNIVYEYTMPNLTPDTRKPSIQGSIEIIIDAPLLTKYMVAPFIGPSEEEAIFEVYLYDRAGNKSNSILTTPIIIYEE